MPVFLADARIMGRQQGRIDLLEVLGVGFPDLYLRSGGSHGRSLKATVMPIPAAS